MRLRPLGDNGVAVSEIGYGAWPLAGHMGSVDQREAQDALRVALDAGVTVVDTAQGYYDSELLLAPVLAERERERIFLVSKVSRDYEPAAIEHAIEASLRRLGTDHLDLYFIHHWPDGYPLTATLEAMARIRERGLVRFLGVSNFDAAQTRAALAVTSIEAVQPRYSLLASAIEDELLPLCREQGIGVLAHSSLAKGLLSGRYDRESNLDPDDERSRMPAFNGDVLERALDVVDGLREMAADKAVSPAQLALAWVLGESAISSALVGPKRPEQMTEALGALEVSLTAEEREALSRLAAGKQPPEGAFDRSR